MSIIATVEGHMQDGETGMRPPAIQRYLRERFGAAANLREVRGIGGDEAGALKAFGYGSPLFILFEIDGRERRIVLHGIRRTAFGRERSEDRAAAVWLDFETLNRLPCHVPALDRLARDRDGSLHSVREAEELLLVTEYAPGRPYVEDLVRLRDQGSARAAPRDRRRVEALAAYLAQIHRLEHADELLWRRRVRDLVGHGEGIFGLAGSYTDGVPGAPLAQIRAIEEAAVAWRWRLRPLCRRLRQVHGDFHPYNILFTSGAQFTVLDRSRGEWGEPADDVSCLSINFLLFSLERFGRLKGAFAELHDLFWERYLGLRPDEEIFSVIQPWLAWRALVLASPLWHPKLAGETRVTTLRFARRVLAADRFDIRRINDYLEAPATTREL